MHLHPNLVTMILPTTYYLLSWPVSPGLRAYRNFAVAGFLGYPQPGGGTHPPIPREGVLGKVLGDGADLALR